jgi:hypothetical protein
MKTSSKGKIIAIRGYLEMNLILIGDNLVRVDIKTKLIHLIRNN